MTCWQINLQPLDDFYFGGERNFSFGADDPQTGANYFSRSNHLPQQTALLGMLRKELLRQKDELPVKDIKEAAKHIGDGSFNTEKAATFGKIGKMSPVMLHGDGKYYLPVPLQYSKDTKSQKVQTVSFERGTNGNTWYDPASEKQHPLFQINGFDYKNGFEDGFISIDKSKQITFRQLYKENERVGIQKHALRKPGTKETDDAYYKQVSYRLSKDYPGFKFCFFVQCEEKLTDRFVFLGGEQSVFRMTVTDAPGTFSFENPEVFFGQSIADDQATELVLLSDTCLPVDQLNLCAFGATDATEFRNFRTTVASTKYYDKMLPEQASPSDTPVRGKRMNLLKRGSILVFDDPAKLKAVAEEIQKSHFRDIGYNYFIQR